MFSRFRLFIFTMTLPVQETWWFLASDGSNIQATVEDYDLSIKISHQTYATYFVRLNFSDSWYVCRLFLNTQLLVFTSHYGKALKHRRPEMLTVSNYVKNSKLYCCNNKKKSNISFGFPQFFQDIINSICIIFTNFLHHYIYKYFGSLVLYCYSLCVS